MNLSTLAAATATRDTVFVSHANPEDNTFALWLTLRLGEMGFKVWCDLTKLIGGETFWDKAEDAIRNSTAKFLYVLSRTSNSKDGVLRELQLAQALAKSQSLENFVVPLRIDDLRFEDTTIELQRLLSIQFHPSWEAGFAQLLRRLETDAVPRSSLSGPSAIAAWWAAHRSAEEGVLHEPDEHLSNHFPVTSWPTDLLVHQLHRDSVGKIEIPGDIIVPCSQDGGALFSFASADELTPHLGPILSIRQSRAIPCAGWHEQGCPAQFGPHIVRILKMAWLNFVRQKGLPLHEMANHVQTLFFKAETAQNDTVGYDWRKKLLGRLRLYHFTDGRNIPSIKEHGGIYSLEQCEALGIEIAAPGGDENSQQSDRDNGMDAYVHLCLRNEHPMEYKARSDGRIEKSIFIPISADVLGIDGVRFVPGMSNKKGIESYLLDEAIRDNHLDDAHLDALYKWIDWDKSPDVYERRVRAEKFEIIVPDCIPLDLIKLPNG